MAVHETGTLLRLNLTPTLLGGEGHLRSRFLAAAALLHHPNVVSYVQSVYVEGVTCVLTEYMPAGNLQSLIDVTTQAAGSSGPISPSTHSISKSGGTTCVPWQVYKRLTLSMHSKFDGLAELICWRVCTIMGYWRCRFMTTRVIVPK